MTTTFHPPFKDLGLLLKRSPSNVDIYMSKCEPMNNDNPYSRSAAVRNPRSMFDWESVGVMREEWLSREWLTFLGDW